MGELGYFAVLEQIDATVADADCTKASVLRDESGTERCTHAGKLFHGFGECKATALFASGKTAEIA